MRIKDWEVVLDRSSFVFLSLFLASFCFPFWASFPPQVVNPISCQVSCWNGSCAQIDVTVRQKNGSETDEYFTTTTVNWGRESRSRRTSPSRVAFRPGNARNNVVVRLHKNLYVKARKNCRLSPQNWTLEGKNRTLGEGVENHWKSSDVIYGHFLIERCHDDKYDNGSHNNFKFMSQHLVRSLTIQFWVVVCTLMLVARW